MGLWKIENLEEEQEELETSYDHWENDSWEDGDFAKGVNDKYPGWHLVKIIGFTSKSFTDIDAWLASNVKFGQYERVGWSSNCSYSVGVVFESGKDAMMFKLRWR